MAPLALTTGSVVLALLFGLAAGLLAGLFGVGGGVLFVPTLVALGLGQVEAQATSLVAILPTVVAGAWNQRRYGNLRIRAAIVVGVSSVVGVELGVRIATALPESTLRRLFALFLFGVALEFAWRAHRSRQRYADSS